ncbi:MAG: hypothetical protein IJL97_02015 [Lachnospiraceae bacterium]|nr:hypothetical protein [Lachnospiraceae bacterium]
MAKRHFCIIVIAAFIICLLSGAHTALAEEADLSRDKADSAAQAFLDDGVRFSKVWDSTTGWTEVIPMYDYDGAINSYIYILETKGERTGYVLVEGLKGYTNAVSFSETDPPTYDRSTDGSSDIDKIDWDAWAADGRTADRKLYYFGPSVVKGFFIRKDEDTFIDLNSRVEYSYDKVKEMYDKYYKKNRSSDSGYREYGPNDMFPYVETIIIGGVIFLAVLITLNMRSRAKKAVEERKKQAV